MGLFAGTTLARHSAHGRCWAATCAVPALVLPHVHRPLCLAMFSGTCSGRRPLCPATIVGIDRLIRFSLARASLRPVRALLTSPSASSPASFFDQTGNGPAARRAVPQGRLQSDGVANLLARAFPFLFIFLVPGTGGGRLHSPLLVPCWKAAFGRYSCPGSAIRYDAEAAQASRAVGLRCKLIPCVISAALTRWGGV